MFKTLDNCDAGDVVAYEYKELWPQGKQLEVVEHRVCMKIKAPRGRMVIFEPSDISDPCYGTYIPQSQAVKAFMEQHTS